MSKIISATCVGGVVSVAGIPVPGVTLLSEGVANSSGILILDEERAYYVTNIGNDLDTTLGKLIALIEKLADALTKATDGFGKAVDSLTKLDTKGFLIGAASAVPAAPFIATDIAGITTAKNSITSLIGNINTIKGEIQTLKGNLQ